jgi:hypothetical protein
MKSFRTWHKVHVTWHDMHVIWFPGVGTVLAVPFSNLSLMRVASSQDGEDGVVAGNFQ